MSNSVCFTSVCSFNTPCKPGLIVDNKSFPRTDFRVNEVFKSSRNARIQSVEARAADKNQSVKPKSIVCEDCEGNGAKQCHQCKGTGVNAVDHFNGRFKAGGLCWLCRGKREILCGNCNGAGFMGGFMSTSD
ncbi:protein BUNDLE SHEATH DEFECTIVE 2, chloroplastic-like [Hibiscus syriacus]|uniref:protein BUNDLE SHEATH DEFECTIVE 2, chloroplastic-like n=1 Tax=Hibiscus syriacus TaxID=106335 RepID=UPI0019234EC4|nr:protein BUNDLE SHEATH DEFECTIVE 2, chloroplastic-like [Hibiscus syriacus]XP_039039120.1 protein BUNDLE SHEATH DEFECTIVE 2, chloroplastic-like [Hibiscus syriacus]